MAEPILNVMHITKTFQERTGAVLKALDDVSISVAKGECVGIVGESGCGKSTLAKVITCLVRPDQGTVIFHGEELTSLSRSKLRAAYQNMKMIFQEPRSSFDPRLTLGTSIQEALRQYIPDRKERAVKTGTLLEEVGLSPKYANLYPRQVSGGECQRAAIARALAHPPALLICDEATSALDVSVQAQIISLLNEVRSKYNISILFISHDLALVSSFCDRTYVLFGGKVVEQGMTREIIDHPREAYTRRLISSVLTV